MTKILIIRFSSIGDIVLTSPVIRCLKTQVKDAEIHFLTKSNFKGVVENNPYIDKCFLMDKHLSKLIPLLKAENYDYVIDLQKNIRSKRVKMQIHALSYSFDKLNFRKWLLVNYKLNFMPDVHIVDRYFQAVKSLGVVNDGKGLDYFIPEKDKVDIKTLPVTHQSGYIAIVIGGNYYTKQFPVKKLISLCKKLNYPIVLLGWTNDRETGEQVESMVGSHLIYNSCGKYNLNQSASLLEQSELIISNDTGLMHIGAALKKYVISIWGNTVPQFGMYPYLDPDKFKIVEVKKLSCRPCSKLGFDRCPKGHFNCMNLIEVNKIVKLVANQQITPSIH